MNQIDRFYFVLDNVVAKSFSWVVISSSKDNKIFSDSKVRVRLYQLEEDFFLGRISKNEFFKQASKLSNSNQNSEEFESIISSKLELNEGIREILIELKKQYALFLFSQYPPEILGCLFSKFNLSDIFLEQNILYSCKTDLPGLGFNLIEKITSDQWALTGRSVWVDSDSQRVSASIRAGIDAIIFIDSNRLRREIALRGLLPLLGNE